MSDNMEIRFGETVRLDLGNTIPVPVRDYLLMVNKPQINGHELVGNFVIKVGDLENDAGYLQTEVDPTVPLWAKQPQKPSYTAEEIHALPDTTFIPVKVSDLENDRGYYIKPVDGIPLADLQSGLIPTKVSQLENDSRFYVKPVGGIPSSDIEAALIRIINGKLDASQKGAPNGVAELDQNGMIRSYQLPSYVDDVKSYTSMSYFPAVGEDDKIYIDKSTNLQYRWGGVDVGYITIGTSLALGETANTAYRGDRGKAAYDHAMAKGAEFASGLYKITTNSEGHVISATPVAKEDITALGIPGSMPDVSGFYTKPATGIPASDLASGVIPDVSGFYTKPVGGIPASDLAAGVIPDISDIEEDLTDVKSAIQGKYTKPSDGIPATDLTQAVQNSLGAANSAYQKPSGGIPATDIADGVIPVVDSALSDSSENAVQNKVVKGALDGKAPVIINTATGNPAVFNDGGGMPIKSLLIPITPQQSGTGDPSPENIRSIMPWNGLTVFGGGKNLFDASAVIRRDGYLLNDNGVEQSTAISGYTLNRTKVKSGARYTLSGTIVKGTETFRLYYYNGDTFIERTDTLNINVIPLTITVPNDCDGIAIQYNEETVDFSTIQIEAGQTATAYEPYKPITKTSISFPSPVYGGEHEAVSGKLMSKWAKDTLTGSNVASYGTASTGIPYVRMTTQSIIKNNGQALCDSYKTLQSVPQQGSGCRISNQTLFIYDERFTSESVAKELLTENPIEVCYELATPQEQTLTDHQITALVGYNKIWLDTDVQMTVEYPADTETFIANKHRNFIAPELSSMIADTALVTNDFRIVGNNLYKITTAIASGGTLTPNTNCVKTTLAEVIKPLLT